MTKKQISRLPRPCEKCKRKFQPDGKFTKICDDCKKKSNKQKSLTYQKFINTENKYKCEDCGKRFRLKMSLQNHRCN